MRDVCVTFNIDLGKPACLYAYQMAYYDDVFKDNGWDEETMKKHEEEILDDIYDLYLSDVFMTPADAAKAEAENEVARKMYGTKKEEN